MPNYTDVISNFVVGDDVDVERTVTALPAGQTVTKAWLTVKTVATQTDVEAVIQKIITTTLDPDQGQITDDGEADQEAVCYFHLTPTNTSALTAGQTYIFDVQVKTSGGRTYTPFKGTIRGEAQVTQATD